MLSFLKNRNLSPRVLSVLLLIALLLSGHAIALEKNLDLQSPHSLGGRNQVSVADGSGSSVVSMWMWMWTESGRRTWPAQAPNLPAARKGSAPAHPEVSPFIMA
jgi:hypothetical protein